MPEQLPRVCPGAPAHPVNLNLGSQLVWWWPLPAVLGSIRLSRRAETWMNGSGGAGCQDSHWGAGRLSKVVCLFMCCKNESSKC